MTTTFEITAPDSNENVWVVGHAATEAEANEIAAATGGTVHPRQSIED